MTQPFDELLSAFHDGETSPEERARIERELANSPELKAELEGHECLSNLLSELPQDRLPQEFASQVLHAAERETLLPVTPIADPLPLQRGWGVIAVSMLASAAALLLMLNLVDNPDTNDVAVAPGKKSNIETPEVAAVEDAKTTPSAIDLAASTDKLAFNETEKANRASGLGGGDKDALESAALNEALADEVSGLVPPTVIPGLVSESRLSAVQDREADHVDAFFAKRELLAAIDNTTGEIAVVRLVVDDQRKALDDLQTLLGRNRIALSPPEADLAVRKQVEKQRQSNDGYEAVYVEADAERLNAALTELSRDQSFGRLEVVESVGVERLDRVSQDIVARNKFRSFGKADSAAESRGRVAAPGGGSPQNGSGAARYSITSKNKPAANAADKSKADAKRAAPKPADAPTGFKRKKKALLGAKGKNANDAPGESAPQKKQAEKKTEESKKITKRFSSVDELDRISQQLQLSLPRDTYEQLAKRPAENRQLRRQRLDLAEGVSASTTADEKKGAPAKSRRLQVLFLLVPREQPAATPALQKAAARPQR